MVIVMKPCLAEASNPPIADTPACAATDVVWIDAETSMAAAEPAMLPIREMAEKFDVTPRALRFYESKGLLHPTRDQGTRIYGPTDQRQLALILKGRKLGFTLAEICQMIDAGNGRASAQGLKLTRQKCLDQITMFSRQISEALQVVAELQRLYRSLSRQ